MKKLAQFIRICRWLQLIHKDRLAPLENAPFSTLWARKRYRVGQRFRQYLRATNCYKLSGQALQARTRLRHAASERSARPISTAQAPSRRKDQTPRT